MSRKPWRQVFNLPGKLKTCPHLRPLTTHHSTTHQPKDGDQGQHQWEDAVEDSVFGETPIAGGQGRAKFSPENPRPRQANQEAKLEVAAVEKVWIELAIPAPVGHFQHRQGLRQAANGTEDTSRQSAEDKSPPPTTAARSDNSVVDQERKPSKSSQHDHLHERSQGLKSHQGAGGHHPKHRSTDPESLKPPKNPRKPSGGVMNGNVAAMKNHEPAEGECDSR